MSHSVQFSQLLIFIYFFKVIFNLIYINISHILLACRGFSVSSEGFRIRYVGPPRVQTSAASQTSRGAARRRPAQVPRGRRAPRTYTRISTEIARQTRRQELEGR